MFKEITSISKNYALQIGDFMIQNPFGKKPEGMYEETVENIQLCLGENFYFPFFFTPNCSLISSAYCLETMMASLFFSVNRSR